MYAARLAATAGGAGGYGVRETGEMKTYLPTEPLWEAARTLVVTHMSRRQTFVIEGNRDLASTKR
jgi:hypothetical protein